MNCFINPYNTSHYGMQYCKKSIISDGYFYKMIEKKNNLKYLETWIHMSCYVTFKTFKYQSRLPHVPKMCRILIKQLLLIHTKLLNV